ncbi:trypsin-2-like [Pieris napi]|uniref:trypsin-2-like n=1 Tax=Pieris napi TaxID=78633 RepID=UPI001FBAF059|nr:trypsin-2-like [Pieris napi]
MNVVKSCFVLFFCLLVQDVVCRRRVHLRHDGRIVGGYNTTIQSFPYQVYLLLRKGKDYYQCGGSILNENNVLTAAHCLTGMEEVFVRAGSTDSFSGSTQYESKTFFQHPLYNTATSDYDVGYVRLPTRMTIDGQNTKRTTLVARNTAIRAGQNVTVSGWGATAEKGDTSDTLMAVQVQIVSNEDCRKSYGNTITSRMFCAGVPEGGKDSCQGDSGGPVVFSSNTRQLGVVSFGIGCARKGTPGVYTNLANPQIRRWIRLNTGA